MISAEPGKKFNVKLTRNGDFDVYRERAEGWWEGVRRKNPWVDPLIGVAGIGWYGPGTTCSACRSSSSTFTSASVSSRPTAPCPPQSTRKG